MHIYSCSDLVYLCLENRRQETCVCFELDHRVYFSLLIIHLQSQWALMTLLDPANSFANLVYVGYSGDFNSAFTITRKRRVDRKKQQTQRNVFQCYVFGPKGSGKTALLQSFLGRYYMRFPTFTPRIFIPRLYLLVTLFSLLVLIAGNLLMLYQLIATGLQQILLNCLM